MSGYCQEHGTYLHDRCPECEVEARASQERLRRRYKNTYGQTPGKPGPAIEDIAERMAEESEDWREHAVHCPCQICASICKECELPKTSSAHLQHCPEAIRG